MLHVFHSVSPMNRGDRLNLDGMDGNQSYESSGSSHWCLRRRISTKGMFFGNELIILLFISWLDCFGSVLLLVIEIR